MADAVTPLHNVKHRAEMVVGTIKRLYEIDAEIAELTKKYLAHLREEKSALKKRLRQDFQMPAPLITARYAGYKVERKALDSKDSITLTAIREMYQYLPVASVSDDAA